MFENFVIFVFIWNWSVWSKQIKKEKNTDRLILIKIKVFLFIYLISLIVFILFWTVELNLWWDPMIYNSVYLKVGQRDELNSNRHLFKIYIYVYTLLIRYFTIYFLCKWSLFVYAYLFNSMSQQKKNKIYLEFSTTFGWKLLKMLKNLLEA